MHTYKVMRFYKEDRRPKLIKNGLNLEEAREHCSKKITHKIDKEGHIVWFDGYEKEE